MKKIRWQYARFALISAGVVGVLVSCNSHTLLQTDDPEVVIIDPPPAPTPPPVQLTDAGVPSTGWDPVNLAPLPDGATPDLPPPRPDLAPGQEPQPEPDLPPGAEPPPKPDAAPDVAKTPDLPPDEPPAPIVETLVCPSGTVRVHVRDLWSAKVDPTLKTMTDPPLAVVVTDAGGSYTTYGARVDGTVNLKDEPPCTYYSVCIPSTVTTIKIKPVGGDGCPGTDSGPITISSVTKNKEFWLEYDGTSSALSGDYSKYPNVPIGGSQFFLTADVDKLTHVACKLGTPPDAPPPSGFTKVHFRWPWNDPVNPATPYPGSGCGADKLGFTVPPYPSSLTVRGFGCDMQAVLEAQDGKCPWYFVMVPNSAWTGTPKITFRYPDETKGLYTNDITLPKRTDDEYWIAYAGAPDNTSASKPKCQDWSLQTNTYFVYTENPGPGYPGCGGDVAAVDPCAPPQPSGYHTVHFRYLWAGQKTFTFFPNTALMPRWMELELGGGSSLKVICYREQDRPWYECPVPDSAFTATTTWRGVDKTHEPEWNTVAPHPLPKEPKDYWIRWYYGKPDIPRTVDPPNFMVYDYYPDGTNGDWSATGVWNDGMCAPKPPATMEPIGFGNGAWFPYTKAQYKYPYGMSLAYIYPDAATVQDLFNAFVWERYKIWKQNYIVEGSNACGNDTARVRTDPPETVSEGQGYGLAIAAGIGDKELVTKLWNFIRHYRTQARYCGLMGWMWQGTQDCQPLDAWATGAGNHDSAFDGDVDIAIGLVFAALQWPEFTDAATDWLVRMECEINTKYGDGFNYPTKGDTWNKNCQDATHCDYDAKTRSEVFMDYYPPGYFRVFGDFLAAHAPSTGDQAANGQSHKDFWYKTAETVWEMVERCYDQAGMHPGLISQSGDIVTPCANVGGGQPYEWGRSLWRLGIDAAWFGNNQSLPENAPNSSPHYAGKSRIQAKMDATQAFFNDFYKKNPVEENANRFSSICDNLGPAGDVTDCDPAYGHNSYTVNLALCPYVSMFNAAGATTSQIRREAIEESITTTVQNDKYFQESLGVYSILFMTGNYPNPVFYSGL